MSGLQIGTAIGMFTDAMAAHSCNALGWGCGEMSICDQHRHAQHLQQAGRVPRARRASMSGLQIGPATRMFTVQWQRTAANALGWGCGEMSICDQHRLAQHLQTSN
jgi:hypothetical protein